ncbi:MAG: wax ester/triacylglycerol synthase family O-acyltransferase [Nitrospirae bacterium]|nr:wax ester/triacylglycerol synthase family O-acyltransferase [Nitrospirota bacterium]
MGHFERMTVLDASFLHLENASNHMHVGICAVFKAGRGGRKRGLAEEEAVRFIESRLPMVPRFRQKIHWLPIERRPVWIDDPNFNIRYHVRFTALPRPGGDAELKTKLGRVMSQALDRNKPLWEMWFVEGLSGGRVAILSKAHHCMVDGVAGMDLASLLLSTVPDPVEVPSPEAWAPRPGPTPGELLIDVLRRQARMPLDVVRLARRAARDPADAYRKGRLALRAVSEFLAPGLHLPPRTPFNTLIGPHRRFEWVETSLSDVKAVKNALGGTVNDVVLTIVAGALRRFLTHRGEKTAGIELKAMVPVSVRGETERTMGNRVAGMVAVLPVGESDPRKRLERVKESTSSAKEAKQALGADVIMKIADWGAPNLIAQAARLQVERLPFNLVVTNVPGPQFPLYLQGAEMVAAYPVVPLSSGLALGIALVSYQGKLCWGLNADWDVVPDLDIFARHIREASAEIQRLTGVKS